MSRSFLFLLVLCLIPPALLAQRNAKIPDPDPEIERKTFVLPEGFDVNLWAADPLLAKPIQMNFDSKGRLWVASSEVYPQIKPGQKADDKILILEDTKGEGKADKTTIFARGLLIPTAVEPDQDGGCYAADSTDLVHFGKPDAKTGESTSKRIVLSGFGTEDTHHILHTFRTGPDCRLYMSQSIYIHSHIETPHGVRRLNAGGIWQFRPESEKLEVFARGWVNSWGTAWNKYGTTFATDGAGGEGINYVVPGAAYTTARDVSRILPGLNPGSPKYCGLEVVSGRHLPDEWQQNLITNDFRGHRVCRYIVKEDGSGFQATEQKEVIKSTHPAFRPIDVKMGPDGAIYIADWYNPIIQHGEVDFRDERRDKTHGRIWRVTAKGRKLVEKPKISGAKVEELLELLKSPEDWTRAHARRELKARGAKEVLPKLKEWVEKITDEHTLLEALWVYEALEFRPSFPLAPGMMLMSQLLYAKGPDVRAATWRVVAGLANKVSIFGDKPLSIEEAKMFQQLLLNVKSDEHPRARLEQVRTLANYGGTASAIASALDKPTDRWLDYAIWLSLRETKDQWLSDVKAGKFDFGGDPKKIVFALKAVGEANTGEVLANLLRQGKVDKAKKFDVLQTLCEVGNAKDIEFVLLNTQDPTNEDPLKLQRRILPAVEQAIKSRKLAKSRDSAAMLFQLVDESEDAEKRRIAARILGFWKHEEARESIENLAKTDDPLNRTAAFEALASFGDAKAVAFTKARLNEANDGLALLALAKFDTKSAAEAAPKFLKKDAEPVFVESLFAAFVAQKKGTAELATALGDTKLSADVAKVGIRVARSSAQPDQKLIDVLTKAGGLTEPKRTLTKAELEAMMADVKTKGDPARGEAIYRKAELNCLKCHGIAGAGGQVGPDMTSIGASAQVDYLIESLLNPNAKIKEGYNSFVINTEDGQSYSGIKVRETDKEIVFRDAEDRLIAINKADKPEIKNGQSLMPVGLTDGLTSQEFLDLVRFLSELGKGSYLAQPGKVVRTYQAVQPTKELFTAVTRDRLAAVATAADLSWNSLYSAVSGDVPLGDLTKWKIGQGEFQAAIRFRIDVSQAGGLVLNVPDDSGLSLWLDGTPIAAGKAMELKVEPGVRTVTVHVALDKRKEPVRIELAEAAKNPARYHLLGGK